MSFFDSSGITSGPVDGPGRSAHIWPQQAAAVGMNVMHRGSRFRGKVLRFEGDAVVVRSATGIDRVFRLQAGAFAVNGETVTLTKPRVAQKAATKTASGSVAATNTKAKVARAARIWVEGKHDAMLLEKVWGDDLRDSAVVVEPIGGVDNLVELLGHFRQHSSARIGVLVDHLVPGSMETRIADSIRDDLVLITGHPYVDVWQAVRPKVLGIDAWPEIPRGQNWKDGITQAFGFADSQTCWTKLLAQVGSYADLEADFINAVEQLIDFATEPQT